MSSLKATDRPDFDFSARFFSGLSLICSFMIMLVSFMARHGRGIDFGLQIMLILAFWAQLIVFFVFVVIAVITAGFKGGLKITPVGTILTLLAMACLVVQFFEINNLRVDGSTVP